jgi:hypothetical protein
MALTFENQADPDVEAREAVKDCSKLARDRGAFDEFVIRRIRVLTLALVSTLDAISRSLKRRHATRSSRATIAWCVSWPDFQSRSRLGAGAGTIRRARR